MFEKSLTDLIKGIRAHKKDEHTYINKCIEEIRLELKKDDGDYKAGAIAKLTYLQMMGYDFSWAAFHVVEVMASPDPHYKRLGYLAASQSFRQDTEVLMLATNQLKKDLTSIRYMDVGVAINGLCQFLTPDLAQFLCQDLLNLLGHSRGYVRKRATLALYKVFLKFPEGLRLCFPKLKEKLDDDDPAVVTAAVNVICELSRKAPQSYLGLVPTLYRLMTDSRNNWMLIKLVKLFAALTPLEPRLVKKLSGPLRQLIETTPAMSLLSECITTAVVGGFLNTSEGAEAREMAAICVAKLADFLDNNDQNLKYVGLVALGHLQPLYPDLAEKLTPRVLTCLDDFDYSIRVRALTLASNMVTQNELISTVQKLIGQLIGDHDNDITTPVGTAQMSNSADLAKFPIDSSYRRLVAESIITMCKRQSYEHISSFEWYLAALGDLIYVSKVNIGKMIGQELQDVTVRVKSVRSYAVSMMVRLVSDSSLLDSFSRPDSNAEVLSSAAWIIGEYANLVTNPGLLLSKFYATSLRSLSASTQTTFLQAGLKVLTAHCLFLVNGNSGPSIVDSLRSFVSGLEPFTKSLYLEVQERSCNFLQLLSKIEQHLGNFPDHLEYLSDELSALFSAYELKFVSAKAQSKVPTPEDLDLDSWVGEQPTKIVLTPKASSRSHKPSANSRNSDSDGILQELESKNMAQDDSEGISRRKTERKQRLKHDPYYLGQDENSSSDSSRHSDIDSIPVVPLKLDGPSWLPGLSLESSRLAQSLEKTIKNGTRSKKNKKKPMTRPVIDADEMPAGAEDSDPEPNSHSKPGLLDPDVAPLLSVDLSTPLKEGEKLPQIQAYQNPDRLRSQQQDLHWGTSTEPVTAKDKKSKSTKSKSSKSKSSKKSSKSKSKSKSQPDQAVSNLIDLNDSTVDSTASPKHVTTELETNSSQDRTAKKPNSSAKKSEDKSTQVNLPYMDFDADSWGGDRSDLLVLKTDLVELRVSFNPDKSNSKLQFHLYNISDNVLEGCELAFLDSPALKLEGLNSWNILKLTSSLEPRQGYTPPGLEILPTDLERLSDSLFLNGSLAFVANSSRTNLDFQIGIPILAWMSPDSRISPDEFADLVATAHFSVTRRTEITRSFPHKFTPANARDLFTSIGTHLVKNLGLSIVESIDGMAFSLHGITVWDQPVVALVKHIYSDQPTDTIKLIFEFKAHVSDLVDTLLRDLDTSTTLL